MSGQTAGARPALTDYERGLLHGQVDILEQVAADIEAGQDPKLIVEVLLRNARQRAAARGAGLE